MKLTSICIFAALIITCPSLLAQEETESVSSQRPPAELTIDWGAELAKGGWVGIALIGLALVGVAFSIERFIVVRRSGFVSLESRKKVEQLWASRKYGEAAQEAKRGGSAYGQCVEYLAANLNFPYAILSTTVVDIAGREVQTALQRTYPLLVVSTVAPLLGLLGTIIGMIEAFQKVALLGDTGDASVLADSIGKALITTAVGLVVAIPALALYHFFRSRIIAFGTLLEESLEGLLGVHARGLLDSDPEGGGQGHPEQPKGKQI